MNAKLIFRELGVNRPTPLDLVVLKLAEEVISLRKRVSELERRAPEPQTLGERFRTLIGV